MIPGLLISYETLLYVGLSEARASELWTRWDNWPTDGPRRETDPDDGFGLVVEFDDFIFASLENQADAADDSDQEWRACLERCGVHPEVQDAIMDPHFKYLRLSHSCLYWVKDTIEMRYAGLEEIQRTSREREMQLQRAASRSSGNQAERTDSGRHASLNITTGSSSSSREDARSASGIQQHHTAGISRDFWTSADAIAARNVPGHTTLFRAQDQGRIAGLFDDSGRLDRIGKMLSSAPSDFSATRSLFYFSTDSRVAEYYAAYAKRRANCESVVIICLSIPNAAIESLSEPDVQRIYWPDDEWKELIWYCRTETMPLPPHLRKYRQAMLVIGTISRRPERVYRAMSSWQQVTESCLLEVGPSRDSGPCVQYVFSGEDDGCDFLIQNGARDMKVFPFSASELQAWIANNPCFRG